MWLRRMRSGKKIKRFRKNRSGDGVVSTVKEAIILAMLKEEDRSSNELADVLGLNKAIITKSLGSMKKLGLVDGWGMYSITEKGRTHVDEAFSRIDRN